METEDISYVAGKVKRWGLLGVTALYGAVSAMTCWHHNETDEQSMVQTFGELSAVHQTPGLKFHAPWPFTDVTTFDNKPIQMELGYRLVDGTEVTVENYRTQHNNVLQHVLNDSGYDHNGDLASSVENMLRGEYLMVTGDLGIANVSSTLLYQITDPAKYKFSAEEPKAIIHDVVLDAERRVVGNGLLDDILLDKRVEYQGIVLEEAQRSLDLYDIGVSLIQFKFKDTDPPRNVRESYTEVNNAASDKMRRIEEANKEANKIVPRAIGTVAQLKSEANATAAEIIDNAAIDLQLFNSVLPAYQAEPDVTTHRLMTQKLGEVLGEADRIIVGGSGGERVDVLPLTGGSNNSTNTGAILDGGKSE